MLLQITAGLLQVTTISYYKLRQLYQIIITYGNALLQITADITNYDVITNYVETVSTSSSQIIFEKLHLVFSTPFYSVSAILNTFFICEILSSQLVYLNFL